MYDKISAKDENRYVIRYQGRTRTIHSDLSNVKTNIGEELKPGAFIAERLLLFGIVKDNGSTVVPFSYSKIERFSDKYIYLEEIQNGIILYGLMDDKYKIVLPMAQSKITLLLNGCVFRKGALYNSELNLMIDGIDSVELCPNGNYILCKEPLSRYDVCKYGLADNTGKVLFPCIASKVIKNEDGNVDFIMKEIADQKTIRVCFGIYALFDANGKPLTNGVFDSMKELPNGNLLVIQNGRTGMINTDGCVVIECKYDKLDIDKLGVISNTTTPIDQFCQKLRLSDKYALYSSVSGRISVT